MPHQTNPLRSPDSFGTGAPTPTPRPLPTPSPGGPTISPGPQPVARPPMSMPQPVSRPLEDDRPPKIQAFEQKLSGRKHEDNWNRSPNATGTGAIHVKSFHCKMSPEALDFVDQQINEWLDAHPQYEVKFVNTAIGEWQGKIKEPQLVIQVWV